ncbi:hypothetical protein B0H13DRAFT_2677828 [Mycena leptocephala]|nr:hypothetical protein B0H13DRAFT_2677828 [Mycena leptocephala]
MLTHRHHIDRYGPILTSADSRLERAERTLHTGVFFNVILYGIFVGDGWSFHAARVPVRTPLLTCCGVAGIDDGRDGAWVRYFVFYLFVVGTLMGFEMAMMYQPLVLQYGQQVGYFPRVFLTGTLAIVRVCAVLILNPESFHRSRARGRGASPLRLLLRPSFPLLRTHTDIRTPARRSSSQRPSIAWPSSHGASGRPVPIFIGCFALVAFGALSVLCFPPPPTRTLPFPPLRIAYLRGGVAGPLSTALKSASLPRRLAAKQFASKPQLHRPALRARVVPVIVRRVGRTGGRVDCGAGGMVWTLVRGAFFVVPYPSPTAKTGFGFVATDSVIDRMDYTHGLVTVLDVICFGVSCAFSPLPSRVGVFTSGYVAGEKSGRERERRSGGEKSEGDEKRERGRRPGERTRVEGPHRSQSPTRSRVECPPLPPSLEYPTSYSPPLPLARSRVECPHFVLPTPPPLSPSLLLPTLPSFFPRLLAPSHIPLSSRSGSSKTSSPTSPSPSSTPPRSSTLNAPVRLGPGAMAVSIGSGVPSGSMHRGGRSGWSGWSRGVGGVGHGLVFEDMALVEGTTKGGEGETEERR